MNIPQMPVAVIFDMDGLLFNTEAIYQDAILAAAAEAGYDMVSAISRRMAGCPWHQNRELLLSHYGDDFPVDQFGMAWMRHFDLIAATRLSLKPGVIELLDTLDDLQVPRAIASSALRHNVERHLTSQNLVSRFQEIIAHGDCAASKPAPDPYLKAAERLGVDPELCLALEDSYNGVRSASSAGMMTVMVPDLIEPTDEIRALCTFVTCDLHQVRRAILTVKVGAPP